MNRPEESVRTHRAKQNSRAGESMVLVIVMTLVFFLLGAAVMTAAAAATASASARVVERQGYYYARSMMDTLDASLQKGALGEALESAILADTLSNGTQTDNTVTRTYTQVEPFVLRFSPSFSDAPLTALNGGADGANDVTITGVGKANVVMQDGAANQLVIDLRRLRVEYACSYLHVNVRMHIQYRYSCHRWNIGQTSEGWEIEWKIQEAG